jgi:ABC-type multidrug transport system fused ATPase/permease subunit
MLSTIRQSFGLLDQHSKPWLAAYFVSTMLAAALEALGLGFVFIFFKVAIVPDEAGSGAWIKILNVYLGEPPQAQFLAMLAIIVILAFVIRSCFLMLTSWVALAMRRHIELGMVSTLFRLYLDKPLVWHLGRGNSRLINNIAINVGMVVQHVIIGTIDLVGIAVMVLMMFATMGWLQPVETSLAFAVLVVTGTIYFLLVQHRALDWGKQVVGASEAVWRSVREPLRGIKTVKVFELENYFARQLDLHKRIYLDVFLKQGMVQSAPRLILEVILVGGILFAMVLALGSGRDPKSIVPIMVLFGMAAIRMLPLVTRMLQTLQYMRYSQSALVTLKEDMGVSSELPVFRQRAERDFESLSLKRVSFTYPGADRMAIDAVDLNIRRGEHIALVGLSGAGKTTLADLLLGLIKPEKGQVILNGQPSDGVPAGLFAYVPQEPFIVQDTFRRNIALGFSDNSIDESAVVHALEASALGSVVERLPHGLDTSMGEDGTGLSGGEKQRLGIARALYRDASVLVMDEPTSSLDALTEAEISTTIAGLRDRITLILVAHRLSSIKSFDRVIFMDRGQVAAAGTFSELYSGNMLFRTMVNHLSVASNEKE